MSSSEARRKLVFALALATLVAGAAAMALLGRSEPPAELGAASRIGQALAPPSEERKDPQGREARVAARSAESFVRVYLRYEADALRSGDREALSHFATAQFGGQLLRAPVRVPPGSRAPRQRVVKVAAVHVSLFDGKPALLVDVVVRGRNGAHLLRTSLIRQGGRWVVAGVGP
jgi:hypothetical protein